MATTWLANISMAMNVSEEEDEADTPYMKSDDVTSLAVAASAYDQIREWMIKGAEIVIYVTDPTGVEREHVVGKDGQ